MTATAEMKRSMRRAKALAATTEMPFDALLAKAKQESGQKQYKKPNMLNAITYSFSCQKVSERRNCGQHNFFMHNEISFGGWITFLTLTLSVSFLIFVNQELSVSLLQTLWYFVSYFFIFHVAPYVNAMQKWKEHARDRMDEQQEAPRDSELLRQYLAKEISVIREDMLGDTAQLRKLEKELSERIEGLKSWQTRNREVTDVITAEDIALAKSRQEEFEKGLAELQTHIAKVRGFIDDCENRTNRFVGRLDPMRELSRLTGDADQLLERTQQGIADSITEPQFHLMTLQESVGTVANEMLAAITTQHDHDVSRQLRQIDAIIDETTNLLPTMAETE